MVPKVSARIRPSQPLGLVSGHFVLQTYVSLSMILNHNFAHVDPNQGPDAVHIQQVGQRELKRAPALARRAADIKQTEKQLAEKYNIKGDL